MIILRILMDISRMIGRDLLIRRRAMNTGWTIDLCVV